MGFDFKKKPEVREAADGTADKGYRDRARREKERHDLATDSEFWIAVCFKTQADMLRFRQNLGLGADIYIPGDEFEAKTGHLASMKKGFPKKQMPHPSKDDPLADVPVTDSLEADCYAEADALLSAFRSVKIEREYRHSTDSAYWFCVYFESRSMKERYLAGHGLLKYGDKYLDGSAWLTRL